MNDRYAWTGQTVSPPIHYQLWERDEDRFMPADPVELVRLANIGHQHEQSLEDRKVGWVSKIADAYELGYKAGQSSNETQAPTNVDPIGYIVMPAGEIAYYNQLATAQRQWPNWPVHPVGPAISEDKP